LEAFASQFTSLEADKVRLQREVNSSSLKLEGANKIAAAARQEVDSLKEELSRLKEKLKEEEASRLVAEARVTEKDELLRQSSLALLGNSFYASLSIITLEIQPFDSNFSHFIPLQKPLTSLPMPWIKSQTTL
jgi:uncharacterized coiled-coil protein SlyX